VSGVHLDGCCQVQRCSGFQLVRCTRLQYVVKNTLGRLRKRGMGLPRSNGTVVVSFSKRSGASTQALEPGRSHFKSLVSWSQPTRKRGKLARLFSRNSGQTTPTISREPPSAPSTPTSMPTESAAVRTSRSLGKSSAHTLHMQANNADTSKLESRRPEILSSIRTVLELADSVLDGCPIWGPKAAVSTAAKGITVMQVRSAAAITTA
jgi:hypothetical protein